MDSITYDLDKVAELLRKDARLGERATVRFSYLNHGVTCSLAGATVTGETQAGPEPKPPFAAISAACACLRRQVDADCTKLRELEKLDPSKQAGKLTVGGLKRAIYRRSEKRKQQLRLLNDWLRANERLF